MIELEVDTVNSSHRCKVDTKGSLKGMVSSNSSSNTQVELMREVQLDCMHHLVGRAVSHLEAALQMHLKIQEKSQILKFLLQLYSRRRTGTVVTSSMVSNNSRSILLNNSNNTTCNHKQTSFRATTTNSRLQSTLVTMERHHMHNSNSNTSSRKWDSPVRFHTNKTQKI